MKCNKEKNEHVRHNFLFAFIQDHEATKDDRDICVVSGDESLQNNQTVIAKLYAERMNRMVEAIQLQRPDCWYDMIIQPDNANIDKHPIKELCWEVPVTPNLY